MDAQFGRRATEAFLEDSNLWCTALSASGLNKVLPSSASEVIKFIPVSLQNGISRNSWSLRSPGVVSAAAVTQL